MLDADTHADEDRSLWSAAKSGHNKIVAMFLNRGASLHTPNGSELISAIHADHLQMVKTLRESGAHIHTGNNADIWNSAFYSCRKLMEWS